ncbi:copper(I)-binding protein [Neisseria sp. HSC-16F19]|nr:copper chaperone PCu(A)C [Neisseria sp. HSC-16F19]MCP2040292.1 copper(I)-binding protein [Neisseria sp. HSC-16F19]
MLYHKMLTGICMGLFAAAAWAQAPQGIQVEQAWARFTTPGMSMGGAFMDIHNHSGRDDELVAAETAVAQTVELHTHIHEQGVMRMRQLPGGIALPQGQTVRLQPGGLHLMLMGLQQPLKTGERVTVKLTFRHAPPQTVVLPVETGAGRSGAATKHHH